MKTSENLSQDLKEIIEHLPGDLQVVVEVIGIDAALKLVEAFGGVSIWIPKCTALINEARNKRIKHAYDNGMEVRDIALTYNLTERQIYNVLAAPDPKKPTPSPLEQWLKSQSKSQFNY